jgi:dTDP-4-dehydrorhamnose 3,5-epimerase
MDAFFVPGGFANAILSLQPKSRVLVFSSFSLEESLEDDYRFDVEFWSM